MPGGGIRVTATVIGSGGARDAPAALMVALEHRRYVFGHIGEGFQRAVITHGHRLVTHRRHVYETEIKPEKGTLGAGAPGGGDAAPAVSAKATQRQRHVNRASRLLDNWRTLKTASEFCLTRPSNRATAGLGGMMLTLADHGVGASTIVGPRGLANAVSSWGSGAFIARGEMAIRLVEVDRTHEQANFTHQQVGSVPSNFPPRKPGAGVGFASSSASAAGADSGDSARVSIPFESLQAEELGLEVEEFANNLEWWRGIVESTPVPPNLIADEKEMLHKERSLTIIPILLDPHGGTVDLGLRASQEKELRVMPDGSVATLKLPLPSTATGLVRLKSTAVTNRYAFPLLPKQMLSVREMLSRTRGRSACQAKLETQQASMAYICRTPPVRGKFHPEKAYELGVPKGPLFGRLAAGQTIETPDGRTVRPEDVLGDATPGVVFMVVDCPSKEHFEIFKNDVTVSRCRDVAEPLAYVFHMSPKQVFQDPEYEAWMESLTAVRGTRHVLMAEGVADSSVQFTTSNEHTMFIQKVAGEDTIHRQAGSHLPREAPAEYGNRIPASVLQSFGLNAGDVNPSHERQDELRLLHAETLARVDQALTRDQLLMPPSREFPLSADPRMPCISFLGTGSAVPSQNRNVTGLLLHSQRIHRGEGAHKPWGIMLDCGEGSLGQLCRRFGDAASDEFVCDHLRMIAVSHMHADHHIGAARVLLHRQHVHAARLLDGEILPQQEPLLVVGPRALNDFLGMYSTGVEPLRYRFMWNGDTSAAFTRELTARLDSCDVKMFKPFPVVHCKDAYAFSVYGELPPLGDAPRYPWGMIFSGDTRPCDTMVEETKLNAQQTAGGWPDKRPNNTMLVHEATLDNEMAESAKVKRHCTTHDALTVAKLSGPNQTVLTHFSQRFYKLPVIHEAQNLLKGLDPMLAFDYCTFRIGDMEQHAHYASRMSSVQAALTLLEEMQLDSNLEAAGE